MDAWREKYAQKLPGEKDGEMFVVKNSRWCARDSGYGEIDEALRYT